MIHFLISAFYLSSILMPSTYGQTTLPPATCADFINGATTCAEHGAAEVPPLCCEPDPDNVPEGCRACATVITTTTVAPTTTTVITTTLAATTTAITTCVCPDPCPDSVSSSSGSSRRLLSESDSSDPCIASASTSDSDDSSEGDDLTAFVSTLLSDSDSSESIEFVTTEGCICATEVVTETGSASSDSSESSEEVESAYAAGSLRDNGGMEELLEEEGLEEKEEDYTMMVSLSDFTLMNIWGLFGLLMVANVICCLVCQKRNGKAKKVRVEDEEDFGGSKLDVLA